MTNRPKTVLGSLILCLLAAEIIARTGRTPSEHYADLVAQHGEPAYARVDAPASR